MPRQAAKSVSTIFECPVTAHVSSTNIHNNFTRQSKFRKAVRVKSPLRVETWEERLDFFSSVAFVWQLANRTDGHQQSCVGPNQQSDPGLR
jgi:hypothetical protein